MLTTDGLCVSLRRDGSARVYLSFSSVGVLFTSIGLTFASLPRLARGLDMVPSRLRLGAPSRSSSDAAPGPPPDITGLSPLPMPAAAISNR